MVHTNGIRAGGEQGDPRDEPGTAGNRGAHEQETDRGEVVPVTASGSYVIRGVPRSLHRAARARAVGERMTLRRVLLQGLREYAAGTWSPQPDGEAPEPQPAPAAEDRGAPSSSTPGSLA